MIEYKSSFAQFKLTSTRSYVQVSIFDLSHKTNEHQISPRNARLHNNFVFFFMQYNTLQKNKKPIM